MIGLEDLNNSISCKIESNTPSSPRYAWTVASYRHPAGQTNHIPVFHLHAWHALLELIMNLLRQAWHHSVSDGARPSRDATATSLTAAAVANDGAHVGNYFNINSFCWDRKVCSGCRIKYKLKKFQVVIFIEIIWGFFVCLFGFFSLISNFRHHDLFQTLGFHSKCVGPTGWISNSERHMHTYLHI